MLFFIVNENKFLFLLFFLITYYLIYTLFVLVDMKCPAPIYIDGAIQLTTPSERLYLEGTELIVNCPDDTMKLVGWNNVNTAIVTCLIEGAFDPVDEISCERKILFLFFGSFLQITRLT